MTELSNRLLHSQSRLTQRVDRLAKRNLVSREKCPDDGRGKLACLTPEGLRMIQALAPTHVRDVRRVLIDLIEPAERPVVAAVFERVVEHARRADAPVA
jgi:DNA-binding MarR family transcriptional regulator